MPLTGNEDTRKKRRDLGHAVRKPAFSCNFAVYAAHPQRFGWGVVYQGRNKKDRYFHPEIDPNDIGRDF